MRIYVSACVYMSAAADTAKQFLMHKHFSTRWQTSRQTRSFFWKTNVINTCSSACLKVVTKKPVNSQKLKQVLLKTEPSLVMKHYLKNVFKNI